MNWIGPTEEITRALAEVKADKNNYGEFPIGGIDGLFSFLGMGDEVIVEDAAYYFLNGEKKNLVELLKTREVGFSGFMVI